MMNVAASITAPIIVMTSPVDPDLCEKSFKTKYRGRNVIFVINHLRAVNTVSRSQFALCTSLCLTLPPIDIATLATM